MEDVSLRLEFHRALDAITPPAPWIPARFRDELRRQRRESLFERARRRPADFAWLLPALAVLLAIAILIGLILGHRVPWPPPLPSRPHAGAAVGCPTWGYIPGGPSAPSSLKMYSLTVGWAPGALRTTDGGSSWHDVSPRELRSGEPFLPGQQTVYPPNYNDFVLDADHAWLVRSYGSDTACIDRYAIFRTSDGGRSWHSSVINAGNATGPVLDFIDPQHGWLLLSVPNPAVHVSPSVFGRAPQTSHTIVYRTIDGGQSWRRVSNAGPPCGALIFITPTRGFAAGSGQFNNCQSLFATDDGGATWSTQLDAVSQLTFFDQSHGAAIVNANGGYGIAVTSDGGHTWQQTATAQEGTTFAPGGFEPYSANVWFEDEHDFWLFTTQPGWAKGGVENDWLYHSADGGATWQLVQRNTPAGQVLAVSFVDPDHGFVLQTDVNGAIQLLTTSDGGHTWKASRVNVS